MSTSTHSLDAEMQRLQMGTPRSQLALALLLLCSNEEELRNNGEDSLAQMYRLAADGVLSALHRDDAPTD